MQNIDCGVNVPAMGRAADGAGPAADSQPLGGRILAATGRAELAGQEKAADGDQLPAILVALISNLVLKFAPAGVLNGTIAILVLAHHRLLIQALDADYIIVAYQLRRYLMYRVFAPITELTIQPPYFFRGLPPAIAPPSLPLELVPQVLQSRELALIRMIQLHAITVRRHSIGLNPQVNADGSPRCGERPRVRDVAKRDIVAVGSLACNRGCNNSAADVWSAADFDIGNLRQLDPVANDNDIGIRVAVAVALPEAVF